ncbi:MAG TPA: amino acid adenylation domain-containing protein, partial [Candidatus Polarisedimenticolia bacterium]|nr:amino acid adenylation domain-containing protein [Candidatus Polarisedimenticolia bacterium]
VFEEGLDAPSFEAAWQKVSERHPPLRTSIVWEGLAEPLQIVRRNVVLPWVRLDWRGLGPIEQRRRLDEFLLEDRERGFDLSRAPLMRFALIRMSDAAHRFVWSHHHLLMDGWSVPVILEELFLLYESLRSDREPSLAPARPYREYIGWLRHQNPEEAESFWRGTLRDFSSPTPLPIARPDPEFVAAQQASSEERLDSIYAVRRAQLTQQATASLEAFARRNELTLATLVRSAWAILLSRYSGETDVLFGSVVSGRPVDLPGSEAMVGLFINTLPLRLRVPEGSPLLPWLREVQSRQFEMLPYEQTPLVQIQGWSEIPRGRSLFETILVFENYPVGGRWLERLEALKVRDLQAWDKTNYPITVAVSPGPILALQIVYDRRRFDAESMGSMLGHLTTLLGAMPSHGERPVHELPLLTRGERRRVLVEWSASDGSSPETASGSFRYPERTIHELFEEQAARRPDEVAIVFEKRSLSYRTVDRKAGALARRLRSLGIGREATVALCLERSPEVIVGMLGILKAGGVYVPLDPAYPRERLEFMLKDSRARVILTQRHLEAKLPGHEVPRLCLDDPQVFASEDGGGDCVPDGGANPDHLAFVVYTSGSTGMPKGIQVTHRGVIRLVKNSNSIRYGRDDVVLQAVSLSFDPSAMEIWGCLTNGGRLIMLSSRNPSLEEIGETLRESGTTTAILVTGLFPLMVGERLDDLKGLRRLIVGGDVMPPAAARRVLEAVPGLRLVNAYGPTEGTVVACAHTMTDPAQVERTVSIGRPVACSQVYVLDRHLRPQPANVPGELFIGGDGVARGYHDRPDLTAERFVPNPLGGRGTRLYRTGDRARWRSDGRLDFLGRLDDQVKVRGFRIEPGEVEAVLGRHPSVGECAVVAHEDSLGERRLAAYVVPGSRSSLLVGELRTFLKEKLPDFMIPAAFVVMERLPLTPNGKVDRGALQAPNAVRAELVDRTPPRTPMELEIASLWREVLRVASPGLDDDFFEAGGHSLLATQLVSRVRSRLGPIFTLRDLYDAPTVRGIALHVEEALLAGARSEEIERTTDLLAVTKGDGIKQHPGVQPAPIKVEENP